MIENIKQPRDKDGHFACPLCDPDNNHIAVGHQYRRVVYCQKHYREVKGEEYIVSHKLG